MEKKKLVPKRRFEGFDGEWEERIFEDLLDSSEGIRRGPFGSMLKKDIFVSESNYVVYEQYNAISDKYNTRYNITQEKYEELQAFKLEPGDFIMSGAGTIGRISRVPEGIKQGVFNQALIRIKTNQTRTESEFFLQWMRSDNIQKKLTEANPASAMVNLVPMSEVKSWNVIVPNNKEQQKVGQFFKQLDEMIAIQQQKVEKTKALKSAYLAEMFPADGKRVPKRRVTGFKGEWGKKRIEDIADTFSGGTPNVGNPKYYRGDIPFIRSGEINSKRTELFITKLALGNSSAKFVEKGDILYALYGATSGEVGIAKINGAINQAVLAIKLKSNYNSYFLKQWLKKHKAAIINKQLQGGQGNLSGEIVRKLVIDLPSLEEQQKIGAFFKQLDEKINNAERKLEKLKAIKRAYLQEMFV